MVPYLANYPPIFIHFFSKKCYFYNKTKPLVQEKVIQFIFQQSFP